MWRIKQLKKFVDNHFLILWGIGITVVRCISSRGCQKRWSQCKYYLRDKSRSWLKETELVQEIQILLLSQCPATRMVIKISLHARNASTKSSSNRKNFVLCENISFKMDLNKMPKAIMATRMEAEISVQVRNACTKISSNHPNFVFCKNINHSKWSWIKYQRE